MSDTGRRFDPSEVRPDAGPMPTDAELASTLAAARELEALVAREHITPTEGFADRVMAAIATEPAPRLVARPAHTLRFGRLAAFVAAIRDSWAVGMSGGRPLAVRAHALSFVLLVVLAAGSLSTVAAIGALNLLSAPSPTPAITPVPTVIPTPAPTQSPSSTADPGPSASPDESPEASESEEPGETEDAGPTSSDDHHEGEATDTAKPTKTPRPTETPRATKTPRPTETPEPTDDDNSGHGGGGDSGETPHP